MFAFVQWKSMLVSLFMLIVIPEASQEIQIVRKSDGEELSITLFILCSPTFQKVNDETVVRKMFGQWMEGYFIDGTKGTNLVVMTNRPDAGKPVQSRREDSFKQLVNSVTSSKCGKSSDWNNMKNSAFTFEHYVDEQRRRLDLDALIFLTVCDFDGQDFKNELKLLTTTDPFKKVKMFFVCVPYVFSGTASRYITLENRARLSSWLNQRSSTQQIVEFKSVKQLSEAFFAVEPKWSNILNTQAATNQIKTSTRKSESGASIPEPETSGASILESETSTDQFVSDSYVPELSSNGSGMRPVTIAGIIVLIVIVIAAVGVAVLVLREKGRKSQAIKGTGSITMKTKANASTFMSRKNVSIAQSRVNTSSAKSKLNVSTAKSKENTSSVKSKTNVSRTKRSNLNASTAKSKENASSAKSKANESTAKSKAKPSTVKRNKSTKPTKKSKK